MFTKASQMLFILLLTLLVLACVASISRASKSSTQEQKASSVITIPQDTVEKLYLDTLFRTMRIPYSAEDINHLSPMLSKDLQQRLEQFQRDVDAWMNDPANAGLKLPAVEGPLFMAQSSNIDRIDIGQTQQRGKLVAVAVSLASTTVMGRYEWQDRLVLKQVDGQWLLDNIEFDTANIKGEAVYTLDQRLRLED